MVYVGFLAFFIAAAGQLFIEAIRVQSGVTRLEAAVSDLRGLRSFLETEVWGAQDIRLDDDGLAISDADGGIVRWTIESADDGKGPGSWVIRDDAESQRRWRIPGNVEFEVVGEAGLVLRIGEEGLPLLRMTDPTTEATP
ncbi:MAG: hypothetical protein AAF078_02890 [Planctomycetota bacterium]